MSSRVVRVRKRRPPVMELGIGLVIASANVVATAPLWAALLAVVGGVLAFAPYHARGQ